MYLNISTKRDIKIFSNLMDYQTRKGKIVINYTPILKLPFNNK